MLALARLYAGTGDRVISERILDMWENHEISNIRDCALLALNLIGNKELLVYCDAMRDIDSVKKDDAVWNFCSKSLRQDRSIDWSHFDELLSMHRPMRDRLFSILRLKTDDALTSVGNEVQQVFENLNEIVLLNVVGDRLVLQAALACVSQHEYFFDEVPHLRDDVLDAARRIRSMCPYREARKAADAVLKTYCDHYTHVFELFPASPASPMQREAYQKTLMSKFPEISKLRLDPAVVLIEEYDGDLMRFLHEDIRDPSGDFSFAKSGVYEIVMLYYLILQIDKMKKSTLEALLASTNMFERYIALVHIGVAGLTRLHTQVEYILDMDSISDVRGCAEVVLAELNARKSQEVTPGNSNPNMQPPSKISSRSNVTVTTSDLNDLLKLERAALVRECPQVTSATTEEECKKYLASFGL
jgi:hypothetical protein